MARQHDVPNFMTSFLDLLCSALGGVALLVFLFAALRKNEVNQEAAVGRQTLVVEVVRPDHGFEVERDVVFQIEPQAQRQRVAFRLDRDEAVKTKGFEVTRSFPGRVYDLDVRAAPGTTLRLDLWLRAADADRLADPAYLDGLTTGVRGKVYWSGRPDESREFRLDPANQFVADLTLEVP